MYHKRLKEAIFRCAIVHSKAEKTMLYVDGLYDTIHMLLDIYRESMHRLDFTFESLCHFAKSEGDAYRTRLKHVTSSFTSDHIRGHSISLYIVKWIK